MDIISKLEAKDIQKQNIERGDPIFKEAIAEIESLRAQLASQAQPTPSQSVDTVVWNFEYDQLTEDFIHELDDKTVNLNVIWKQYY